jgi:hypothetical protein
MAQELPIACTLTGAELPERLAEIAGVGRDGLVSVERHDASAVLRFRAEPALRERLAAVVEAESRCCSFLDLRLADEPGATVLNLAAPAGGEAVLHGLVDAFGAERAAGR